MANLFDVEIVTPAKIAFSGQSSQLSLPGVSGSLGILANHAPLLTELKIGEMTLIDESGTKRRFYIGSGFVEVLRNHVTILAEEAMPDEQIDPAEAERSLQKAREVLEHAEGEALETAQREYTRAEARARLAQKPR
jgi:F-type H+-transporting ATPase subunit epsilon